MARFIVHVDMDAFFAAIEQRDNPKLLGKPVIVGAEPKAGKGRGVVSTCSYEARVFGIHSAMPISIAYRRCPQAVFLPVDIEKYHMVSEKIYQILYTFTPIVEVVSIDEAFLDISGSHQLFGGARQTCLKIKETIHRLTGLSASLGLAPTKMVAKIASDLEKPDGFVEVKQERLRSFLEPLDIGKLWGVGRQSKRTLQAMGIRTVGELAKTDPHVLEAVFGKNGIYFWQLAQGIDQREVESSGQIKSISNEITFAKDSFSRQEILAALLELCEKVSQRLRRKGYKAKTVTLKIRLSSFDTYTRSRTLAVATNFTDTIYTLIKRLFSDFDRRSKGVRLVGVKASGLCGELADNTLFSDEESYQKKKRIHQAMDAINYKFGPGVIRRARIPIIVMVLFLNSILFSFRATAGVITLTSGEKIFGTIITKTKNYIVVDTAKGRLTFYNDEIASIRGRKPVLPSAVMSEMTTVQEALWVASQGKFLYAEEAFRQILQKQPESLSSRKAIEIIDGVRKGAIEPEYALVLFEGAYYFYNQDFKRALEVYISALEKYPVAVELYYNIANSYLVLGNISNAIAYFEKFLEYRPDDSEVLVSLALAHQALDEHEKAIYYFKKVITSSADNAEVWLLLGSSYAATGQIQLSREAFRTAEQIYSRQGNQEKIQTIAQLLADITQ